MPAFHQFHLFSGCCCSEGKQLPGTLLSSFHASLHLPFSLLDRAYGRKGAVPLAWDTSTWRSCVAVGDDFLKSEPWPRQALQPLLSSVLSAPLNDPSNAQPTASTLLAAFLPVILATPSQGTRKTNPGLLMSGAALHSQLQRRLCPSNSNKPSATPAGMVGVHRLPSTWPFVSFDCRFHKSPPVAPAQGGVVGWVLIAAPPAGL